MSQESCNQNNNEQSDCIMLSKGRMRFEIEDKRKIQVMCDLIRAMVAGKSSVVFAWHRSQGWSILQNMEYLGNLDSQSLVNMCHLKPSFFEHFGADNEEFICFELNLNNYARCLRSISYSIKRMIWQVLEIDTERGCGHFVLNAIFEHGQLQIERQITIVKRGGISAMQYFRIFSEFTESQIKYLELKSEHLKQINKFKRNENVIFKFYDNYLTTYNHPDDLQFSIHQSALKTYEYATLSRKFQARNQLTIPANFIVPQLILSNKLLNSMSIYIDNECLDDLTSVSLVARSDGIVMVSQFRAAFDFQEVDFKHQPFDLSRVINLHLNHTQQEQQHQQFLDRPKFIRQKESAILTSDSLSFREKEQHQKRQPQLRKKKIIQPIIVGSQQMSPHNISHSDQLNVVNQSVRSNHETEGNDIPVQRSNFDSSGLVDNYEMEEDDDCHNSNLVNNEEDDNSEDSVQLVAEVGQDQHEEEEDGQEHDQISEDRLQRSALIGSQSLLNAQHSQSRTAGKNEIDETLLDLRRNNRQEEHHKREVFLKKGLILNESINQTIIESQGQYEQNDIDSENHANNSNNNKVSRRREGIRSAVFTTTSYGQTNKQGNLGTNGDDLHKKRKLNEDELLVNEANSTASKEISKKAVNAPNKSKHIVNSFSGFLDRIPSEESQFSVFNQTLNSKQKTSKESKPFSQNLSQGQ